MDELQGRRLRRLRARRSEQLPVPPETVESLLPDVPRVGALDALLREVDSLRLTLETDLTLAASAVEAGALQVAADIIDCDREILGRFEERALDHVGELAAPKRRVKVPVAPFVAAAAVAAFLIGVVPQTSPSDDANLTTASLDASNESLERLQQATESGQTADAVIAAEELHAQLRVLVEHAKTDPQAAADAIALLFQERAVLALTGDESQAVKQLLAESQHLTTLLASALPKDVAAKVLPTATAAPVALPTPRTTTSPKAKPTSSPSPKAKPTTSPAPKPSSTPAPGGSASPSDGPLPGTPGLN